MNKYNTKPLLQTTYEREFTRDTESSRLTTSSNLVADSNPKLAYKLSPEITLDNEPTVSVVIASYNHGLYVAEALQSVLDQTYQNFEIIVTDDGSTDNSVEVIKKFNDPRIKLFEFKENQGACAATNNSINNSKGKYIAIMNSDDVWALDKLEKQINFLEQNKNIDAVFSSVEFLDENMKEFSTENRPYFFEIFKQPNRSSGEWLATFFFQGNCLCHPSILIKKQCYNILGLYDNRFRQLPDFDMWIKFCKNFNLYVLAENLVKFRLLNNHKNASSPTTQNQIRGRNEHHLIMQSFFAGIKLETFKEGFYKHLKNKSCQSEIEYEIEKAFLYLKTAHSIIGIEKLYNFLEQDNYRNILDKLYNFNDKTFQTVSASSNAFGVQDINSLISTLFFKIRHYPKIKLFKILTIRTLLYIKSKLTIN
ncbi:glycosyltransferase family 2 protein [Candidatus Trichorickettsia mobilis]|uniref:glycosyltransferase family 2 protein n=1 Tax=Candidatus Trichorickettsia mobilis TaxID=1346319 RepID=UPI002931CAE8|nr:glycosyltransferase [Candidatus Trichorickettsia mobilis]